jgi:uncharacterized protein YgbK (DUF1537 family)
MSALARPLPPGTLIAYYGDDFTGSSASMEAAAFAGLSTVLFLTPPSPARLASFAGYRVIGLAGTSRAQSPEWMEQNLPDAFRTLSDTGAPILHYKVCSTFDSAPATGSIGRAIDIATRMFPGWVPMVVADPGMARFQAFGNLFAVLNGVGHRLDRHPTMSRHPVTPMDEADLGKHLSKQTAKKIGLVDFVAMKTGLGAAALRRQIETGHEVVSLDVLDAETLIEAGRLIWENRGARLFGVGSQGFEAALAAYWRSAGLISDAAPADRIKPAERIACVSGSVSAITAAQIATAAENGFAVVPLETPLAVDARRWHDEIERAARQSLVSAANGRDVIVHSALGPDDPRVARLATALASSRIMAAEVQERIGTGLGHILDRLISDSGVRRVVIAGGDTSGRAASRLGIDALTAIAPLAPGAPLCRAHAERQDRAGLEIVLKGGQVGPPDFFMSAKLGR